MNKIKNLLKASPLAMVVVSLLTVGVASAAIVSYISNPTTVKKVKVSSPVEMKIYDGVYNNTNTGETSINLIASTGGSSMPFTTIAKNNANEKIGGYYVTVIEATKRNDTMTGKEFTSIMFNKNKTSSQNGEIIKKLCVVEGDGSLTTLAAYVAAGRSNPKLAILLDIDGDSTQVSDGINESLGMCSLLTLYGEGSKDTWTETRSFFHLDPNETEAWTFTPKWAPGVLGEFKISAQYVNDLKAYAGATY